MSESFCACIRVKHEPDQLDGKESGRLRESWKCESCGARFVREFFLNQAKAEIAKLTLLSDSQLANQERLTESREFWKDGWHALDEEKRDIEAQLSTLRANQERLVGEMQELRQVVKEYKTSPKRDHRRCKIWEIGGVDTRCPTCVKADALLAPKDTPTEPTREK